MTTKLTNDRLWRSLVKEVENIPQHPGFRYVFFSSSAEANNFFTQERGADWMNEPWAQYYMNPVHNANRHVPTNGAESSTDLFGKLLSTATRYGRLGKWVRKAHSPRKFQKRRQLATAYEFTRIHPEKTIEELCALLNEAGITVSERSIWSIRDRLRKGV